MGSPCGPVLVVGEQLEGAAKIRADGKNGSLLTQLMQRSQSRGHGLPVVTTTKQDYSCFSSAFVTAQMNLFIWPNFFLLSPV